MMSIGRLLSPAVFAGSGGTTGWHTGVVTSGVRAVSLVTLEFGDRVPAHDVPPADVQVGVLAGPDDQWVRMGLGGGGVRAGLRYSGCTSGEAVHDAHSLVVRAERHGIHHVASIADSRPDGPAVLTPPGELTAASPAAGSPAVWHTGVVQHAGAALLAVVVEYPEPVLDALAIGPAAIGAFTATVTGASGAAVALDAPSVTADRSRAITTFETDALPDGDVLELRITHDAHAVDHTVLVGRRRRR